MTIPSGTYLYSPSLGELTLYAFNLCGIRPNAITNEHMASAVTAANLMNMRWGTRGVNLWQVALVQIPLVQGTSTYSLSPEIIVILDGYITVGTGTGATDRYILPISRTEYASYANKQQQGFPTVYWMDRLLSPTVTVWPVPDGNEGPLNLYVSKQLQDATFGSAKGPDVQSYFLEAYADGLAYRLSKIWAPEKTQLLKTEAMESFSDATTQNVETDNVYLSPNLSGYWRV